MLTVTMFLQNDIENIVLCSSVNFMRYLKDHIKPKVCSVDIDVRLQSPGLNEPF